MTMLTMYAIVTVWTAGPRETFERRHVRVADSVRAAKAAERAHNSARLRDGMAAEGWRARVASCVVTSAAHEAALVALDWHLTRAKERLASASKPRETRGSEWAHVATCALHDVMTCKTARERVRIRGAA